MRQETKKGERDSEPEAQKVGPERGRGPARGQALLCAAGGSIDRSPLVGSPEGAHGAPSGAYPHLTPADAPQAVPEQNSGVLHLDL